VSPPWWPEARNLLWTLAQGPRTSAEEAKVLLALLAQLDAVWTNAGFYEETGYEGDADD